MKASLRSAALSHQQICTKTRKSIIIGMGVFLTIVCMPWFESVFFLSRQDTARADEALSAALYLRVFILCQLYRQNSLCAIFLSDVFSLLLFSRIRLERGSKHKQFSGDCTFEETSRINCCCPDTYTRYTAYKDFSRRRCNFMWLLMQKAAMVLIHFLVLARKSLPKTHSAPT